jgi:hypothetical protein
MLDGEFGTGSNRVRIEGLSKTVRALGKAGVDSQDMKDLMFELGMLIVRAANPPELSSRLAGTIRAGRGKTKAVVRAGGARAPYAGVIHYGWPAHNIAAQPFLTTAIQSERGDLLAALDRGLEELLRNNQLT